MKVDRFMAWCEIPTRRRGARSDTGQVPLRLWLTTQPRTSDLRARAWERTPPPPPLTPRTGGAVRVVLRGPVCVWSTPLGTIPTGEDAGELWDHIAWLAAREDFFEYKRSRR